MTSCQEMYGRKLMYVYIGVLTKMIFDHNIPSKFYKQARCYNDSMECEHVYMEKSVEMSNGGYMIMKTCMACYNTEGFGFLNKEHEDQYLNTLWHQGDAS